MAAEQQRPDVVTKAVDVFQFSRRALREYLESVPTVSVEFTGKAMGISRPAAFRAAATGEIPTIKLGRRRLVPSVWLQHVLMLDEVEPSAAVCETAAPPDTASDSSLCPRDARTSAAEVEDE